MPKELKLAFKPATKSIANFYHRLFKGVQLNFIDSLQDTSLSDQAFLNSYNITYTARQVDSELFTPAIYTSQAYLNETSTLIAVDTNATELPDYNAFILPWYQQAIWTLLFGLIVLTAAGGNLIVILTVITTKSMRTVIYMLISNSFT